MSRILLTGGLLAVTIFLIGQGCLSLTGEESPRTSGPGGMFLSVNKGDAWQPISVLPTAQGVQDLSGVSVHRLFTDPQDTRALYWASRAHGFFYTYDGGQTWQQPQGDLRGGFIYSLAVDPRDRCTLFVTNGAKVHRSEDCSRSWQEVYRESRLEARVSSMVFNPLVPKQLLILLNNGDLLETVDAGKNWQVIHRFEHEAVDLFADPRQRDVFYAASRANGLHRSIDAGRTWVSLRDNMSDFSGANEYRRFYLHPTETGVLYWISTHGILRSDNSGDTWESIDLITPPGSAQIYAFAVNPKNEQELYYTATINNRSTFYRSFDGGVKWATKQLPSGQIPTMLHVLPDKPEVIYLGFTIPTR